MIPLNLYFDFRDIFRSPKLALSGKKMWIFLKANLFGFMIYWILSYLSIAINGVNILTAIKKFGLYPCLYALDDVNIIPQIIYWIGVIIWIITIYFACTAVSRITYKQLRGDDFYSASDAKQFVKNHRTPIIMGWISILIIAIIFVIGAAVFSFIGKIPFIGEILFALLYIVYFFGALFTVYTLLVFIVAMIYSPAIVAALEEDTMGTVFQSYSIAWSQPWRIVTYNLVLIPLFILSVNVFKWFWLASYKLINLIFGAEWLMGTKFANIIAWATDLVNPVVGQGLEYKSTYLGHIAHLPTLPVGATLSNTEYFSATVVALVLFILLFTIVSYGLSILSVGETIILTIIKKKATEENILERYDEDNPRKYEPVIEEIVEDSIK